MYSCMCVGVCMCVRCVGARVCVYVCVHTCVGVCTHAWVCAYVYVVYVCMHLCVCIYYVVIPVCMNGESSCVIYVGEKANNYFHK